MNKLNATLVALTLGVALITSCSNNSKTNAEEQSRSEHHKHDKPVDKKKKGVPEQKLTLDEIGGYKLGDIAEDFSLKNVSGEMQSLANYPDAKGYIVVFTCNSCPFSVMYEDRLIALHNTFAPQGYPVLAINPNVKDGNEKESLEAMKERSDDKGFPFVYLADDHHQTAIKFGAVRTPHIFLLDANKKVQYIGALDDNARSADDVETKYVEQAIGALEKGETPDPQFTKAIGCTVKFDRPKKS